MDDFGLPAKPARETGSGSAHMSDSQLPEPGTRNLRSDEHVGVLCREPVQENGTRDGGKNLDQCLGLRLRPDSVGATSGQGTGREPTVV